MGFGSKYFHIFSTFNLFFYKKWKSKKFWCFWLTSTNIRGTAPERWSKFTSILIVFKFSLHRWLRLSCAAKWHYNVKFSLVIVKDVCFNFNDRNFLQYPQMALYFPIFLNGNIFSILPVLPDCVAELQQSMQGCQHLAFAHLNCHITKSYAYWTNMKLINVHNFYYKT